MIKSIKVLLEQRHNVTVDAEAEMFCIGDAQIYGWSPIPEDWLDDLKCVVTDCGNIVDEVGDFCCKQCCDASAVYAA